MRKPTNQRSTLKKNLLFHSPMPILSIRLPLYSLIFVIIFYSIAFSLTELYLIANHKSTDRNNRLESPSIDRIHASSRAGDFKIASVALV